jgi:hydrogenase-4 membrane subunit HyfE
LLGLFGTLFAGIGLISIPGMILAIRIWRLGYAMLRRDPSAEQEARELEQFAVRLNIVLIAAAVLLFAFEPIDATAVLLMTVLGYAAVSFAHAKAMRRCAELLETKRRLDEAIQLGGYRAASPADRSPHH